MAGNDIITIGTGGNVVDGGTGFDFLSFSTNADVSLDLSLATATVAGGGTSTITGIEAVTTFNGNDTVVGTAVAETINVGEGNNIVESGDGNDSIVVRTGANDIDGGGGFDFLTFETNADVSVDLTLATATVAGGGISSITGVEAITTFNGNDTIVGTASAETMNVGEGNNTVNTGDGNDAIVVRTGANIIDGGAGVDGLTFETNFDVNANLSVNTATVAGGGTSSITAVENITTLNGNDTLVGDASNNVFNSGSGNDFLSGGAGNDILRGEAGSDTFEFRTGWATDSILDFADGQDLIDLQTMGFADIGDLTIATSGANTEIDFGGGDKLILVDFTGALDNGDFLF